MVIIDTHVHWVNIKIDRMDSSFRKGLKEWRTQGDVQYKFMSHLVDNTWVCIAHDSDQYFEEILIWNE